MVTKLVEEVFAVIINQVLSLPPTPVGEKGNRQW